MRKNNYGLPISGNTCMVCPRFNMKMVEYAGYINYIARGLSGTKSATYRKGLMTELTKVKANKSDLIVQINEHLASGECPNQTKGE